MTFVSAPVASAAPPPLSHSSSRAVGVPLPELPVFFTFAVKLCSPAPLFRFPEGS